MRKKYIVDLTPEERGRLVELTQKGQQSARKIKRANILLLADAGKQDKEIAELLQASVPTVERTRRKFVEAGRG
jgi:DNA-binding CsgD family transcriptional regulator